MGAESETRGAENRREQEVEVLANFRRYSNNLPLMSYTCSRRAHFVFAFGAYLVQFDDGTGPGLGVGVHPRYFRVALSILSLPSLFYNLSPLFFYFTQFTESDSDWPFSCL